MSIPALNWAFAQDLKSSSVKFVLVAYADLANNQTDLAFPSLDELHRRTALDRRTIMGATKELAELGLLVDTGTKVGRTGQIAVFRLPWRDCKSDKNATVKQLQKCSVTVAKMSSNSDKNVTAVPCTVFNPKEPRGNRPPDWAIRKDIDRIKEERSRLWCRSALENSLTGTTWRNEDDRIKWERLGKTLRALKDQL